MILDELAAVIEDRRTDPRAGSYVASLLSQGKDEILKKIGEEAVEVIIASKSGDRSEIIRELADLWFHCMVLMAEAGLSHNDILGELEARLRTKEKNNG